MGVRDPGFGGDDLSADKTMLADVIEDTGATAISYVYDLGDGWEHKIEILKIADGTHGDVYPRLTNVIGTCPPEDVGGPPGAEILLEAMADPKHPEHLGHKDWYGDTFDTTAPRSDEIRLEVLKLAMRWVIENRRVTHAGPKRRSTASTTAIQAIATR